MWSFVLLFLVIWCITACAAVSEPFGNAGEKVYYVEAILWPSMCGQRVPCKTVREYIKENATIFQTSGVTWVFLAGQHYLPGPLAITNVHNVTLTGEQGGVSTLTSTLSGGCILLQNVSSLTLQYLTVDDLPRSICSTFIEMRDSVRHFVIRGCCFQHLYSVVSISSELSGDCGTHFDILIQGSVFNSGGIGDREALQIYLKNCEHGPKLCIGVERCHFNGSALSFRLINSTLSSYAVHIKQTGFRFSADKFPLYPMMEFLLHIPYVPKTPLHFNEQHFVNISECILTVLQTRAIVVQYTVSSECHRNPGHLPHRDLQPLVGRVEIANCRIRSDVFRIHPVIESSLVDPCIELATLGDPSPVILALSNNSIIGKMNVQSPEFQLRFPDGVYAPFTTGKPLLIMPDLLSMPYMITSMEEFVNFYIARIVFDRNNAEHYKRFEASIDLEGFR